MTVENTNPIQHFTANGETTVFAISFAVEGKDNIKVTVDGTDVSINDYSYNALTNSVVFNTAPVDGVEVVVERVTSLERSINYQTYNNSFRPETLNYDLDRIWHVLQEQNIVDAEILARIKEEIEWRRTQDDTIRAEIAEEVEARRNLDLNYDTLARVRELQVFDALKSYTDTYIAATDPNVFGGVTAGVVFALDKKSVQTHLEDIYAKLVDERQALQVEENRAKAVEISIDQRAKNAEQNLDQKIEAEQIRATSKEAQLQSNISLETNRATAVEQSLQSQINVVGVGNKAYLTYVAMDADKANITANQKVTVTNDSDATKNGDYQWDGATLTKSNFDVLTLTKNYTDLKTSSVIKGVVSKNLFNFNAEGVYFWGFPNNNTGVIQANVVYNTSDYIEVQGGEYYTVSSKHYWCWYDSNKVFISGTSTSDPNMTQLAPNNAKYARISEGGSKWNNLQFEKGQRSTGFVAYGISLDVTTVQSESLTPDKIMQGSLTPEVMNFFIKTKNIFNKETIVDNLIDNASGNFVETLNYKSSDFIRVKPNTKYVSNYPIRTAAFYGLSKNHITGGVNDSNLTTYSFTTTENVHFVRLGIGLKDVPKFQLEQGESFTTYEPFGYYLRMTNGAKIFTDILDLDGSVLKPSTVSISKVDFVKNTKNLFNKNTVTIGKFMSGTSGSITDNATYDISDFIAITPNTQYVSNMAMRFHTFFDENKNFITGGSDSSGNTFTTNASTRYVRFTVSHSDLNTFQFERGSVSTTFEEFGYKLVAPDGSPILPEASTVDSVSKWSSKKWASLGDSITAGQNWQPSVVGALGLVWTNFGTGGSKISGSNVDVNAMCQDTRLNAIPVDIDVLTLMGGTNDWAQNVPLGDIKSTDPTTFYGALNTFAQKAFARWSTKRIAIATTPYGEIPAWESRSGWTSPSHNALGLTTNDYAEAIRIFCRQANIACIEVAQNAGYGTHNITEALGGSTTDHLHPSSSSIAAKGISNAFINDLNKIAPNT